MNTGDVMIDDLVALSENRILPSVKGQWFNVRWTPDLATGEVLNLGVAFVEENTQEVFVRTLDNFARLNCLYTNQLEPQCKFLIKTFTEALRGGRSESPSPNISYSPSKWTQGDDIDGILEELFNSTVTLTTMGRVKNVQQQSKKPAKVVEDIYDGIRRRTAFQAETIIPQNEYLELPSPGGERRLYLPLRGPDHIGTIVSNLYLTARTNEMHILKGTVDLETARQIRDETNFGMFVQKPIIPLLNKNYSSLVNQMDDLYDNYQWHMSRQGIEFKIEEDAGNLVSDIIEWSGLNEAIQ